MLAGLPDADSVYFDTVSQIQVAGWSRGRVVLLGDAAWCVTLFAGYGSSLAVGGADLLGTALQCNTDIPRALHEWENDLRLIVTKKQRHRRAKNLFVPSDPMRLWLHQTMLRLMASPRNHPNHGTPPRRERISHPRT